MSSLGDLFPYCIQTSLLGAAAHTSDKRAQTQALEEITKEMDLYNEAYRKGDYVMRDNFALINSTSGWENSNPV